MITGLNLIAKIAGGLLALPLALLALVAEAWVEVIHALDEIGSEHEELMPPKTSCSECCIEV
jgi:hypothetical protein